MVTALDGDLADLPAHSLRAADTIAVDKVSWPGPITRDWAWGASDGTGARVCIIDSGVDASHHRIGRVANAVAGLAGSMIGASGNRPDGPPV